MVRGYNALLRFHKWVVFNDLGQCLSLVLLSLIQQCRLPLDHNPCPQDLRYLIALTHGARQITLMLNLLIRGRHHDCILGSIDAVKHPRRVLGVYQKVLLLLLLLL